MRIRHFDSGEYLSVSENIFLGTCSSPDNSTLFEFESLGVSSLNSIPTKFILKDSFLKLRHYKTKIWIQLKSEAEGKIEIKNSEKSSDDIAFKLIKSKNNEVWEITFLNSCLSTIQKTHIFFEELNKVPNLLIKKTIYN